MARSAGWRRGGARPRNTIARRFRKRLGVERLEARWLLAQAVLVEHLFRQDAFSISGDFDFELQLDDSYDYIDRMDGTYSSDAAQVVWTSPRDGAGHFQGQAVGDGRSTVLYAGRRIGCAEYELLDEGSLDFTLDAALSQLRVDDSTPTSTRFTSYRDLTGGQCPAPNPVPSRFFGGASDLYLGTFSAAQHTVALAYAQESPTTTVDAPATAVVWEVTDPTDMELTIVRAEPQITVPSGWTLVPQTSLPPTAVEYVDLAQGLEFQVNVHGRPAKTNDVLQPVAQVRLFWADSASDPNGVEIPVASSGGPLGMYWNSSQLHAVVDEFPAPPPGATHLRVAIEAGSDVDANAANSSVFLKIETVGARDSHSGPIGEDDVSDAASLLHADDQAEANTRVYAYDAVSALGAAVQVVDDAGGFVYDPAAAAAIQSLAPGESIEDAIDFLAVRHTTIPGTARHTITVDGANDLPVASPDSAATTNLQPLELPAAGLLANDSDVDNNDQLLLSSVAGTSLRGAAVQLVIEPGTSLRTVVYDPVASAELSALDPDEQVEDRFGYEIVDLHGGRASGEVVVTVTGQSRLSIAPVGAQFALAGQPVDAISILLADTDGDASEIQLSAAADDPSVVAADGFQFSGSGDSRTLSITPASGGTGRTHITVIAADGLGRSAFIQFSLVFGSADDLDQDGVPDAEEDSAPNGGDMDANGHPDSRQANVASLRAAAGNAFINLVAPAEHFLSAVAAEAAPDLSGSASEAQFPLGLIHLEVLVGSAGDTSRVTLRSDLAAPELNRYFQYSALGGPSWQMLMHNSGGGARVFADRVEVFFQDHGSTDQDGSADARISARAGLAHVARPWQNLLPGDVDNNGVIAPQDVLILINQINFGRLGPLGLMPTGSDSVPHFLDPSGDGRLEPVDVLWIINEINSAAAAGEGEAVGAEAWSLASTGPAQGFAAPETATSPARASAQTEAARRDPPRNTWTASSRLASAADCGQRDRGQFDRGRIFADPLPDPLFDGPLGELIDQLALVGSGTAR